MCASTITFLAELFFFSFRCAPRIFCRVLLEMRIFFTSIFWQKGQKQCRFSMNVHSEHNIDIHGDKATKQRRKRTTAQIRRTLEQFKKKCSRYASRVWVCNSVRWLRMCVIFVFSFYIGLGSIGFVRQVWCDDDSENKSNFLNAKLAFANCSI